MKPSLRLRPVTREDCRLLFEWANDPAVRSTAFATEPIAWEDHEQWFAKKLVDPHCTMLIALDETGTPIGQIRFDLREDNDAEVDVHLAPNARGKGYGALLVAEGVRAFFDQKDAPAVHSYIKQYNAASRQTFLKAGFAELPMEHMHGQEVYHFVFKRP